jgi:hypothetical protein
VPGATAGLADVGTRDPQPLVLGGGGKHLLEQLAVAGLDHRALAEGDVGGGDPLGERVAHLLELLEPGDPRLGEPGRHDRVELQSRERLSRETTELVFEPADLTAQLDPCEALVAPHPERAERLSFEQIRHRPNRV